MKTLVPRVLLTPQCLIDLAEAYRGRQPASHKALGPQPGKMKQPVLLGHFCIAGLPMKLTCVDLAARIGED
jgi:hypothetical protein